MEKFLKHILYTWLVAQAIHPFLLRVLLLRGEGFSIQTDIEYAFAVLVFTIPAFLLCFLVIKPVAELAVKPVFRLLIWMITVVLCILVSLLIILFGFGGITGFVQTLPVAIPGCMSALLSITIRYKQFLRLSREEVAMIEQASV